MKYRLRPYIQTVLLATMLTTVSCEDDWLNNFKTDSSKYICFDTELLEVTANATTRSYSEHIMMDSEDWPLEGTTKSATRVAPTRTLLGEAGVIGYKDGDTSPLTEIDDKSYTFESGAMRATGTPVTWNDVNNVTTALHLFVYAPYSIVHGESPVATIDNSTATPKFTYTVPDAVDEQIDLLAANADVAKSSFGSSVPLTFNHILTALRFKVDFPCKVKRLTVNGVNDTGTYTYNSGWDNQTNPHIYTFGESYFTADGRNYAADTYLNRNENTLMLIPQTLPADANVQLEYSTDDGASWQTLTASIAGHKWQPGKRVTYSISKSGISYIYFDLALGSVTINRTSYSGKIRVSDGSVANVTGTHESSNTYYVYQSSSSNRSSTGWSTTTVGTGTCSVPTYPVLKTSDNGLSWSTEGDLTWSEYITNNPNLNSIITNWPTYAAASGRERISDATFNAANPSVVSVGKLTENNISVKGDVGICNLTIDNIYSRYFELGQSRTSGAITYLPGSSGDNQLIINTLGDNRFTNIHYYNKVTGNKLVFEGFGSLTVADLSYGEGGFERAGSLADNRKNGLASNTAGAAIGGSDTSDETRGIEINSGVLYVGTTLGDNATAIGGGGNGVGIVTINGGTITAVSHSTGATIGGGTGYDDAGGPGTVTITGGNVYAYNLDNDRYIPAAAIGGGSSSNAAGEDGNVTITSGTVIAQSVLGTAIGGGSSKTKRGGNAIISISGGSVIAKSVAHLTPGEAGYIPAGRGIGGGTGCCGGGSNGSFVGGDAIISITGGNVFTGSIGGGSTNDNLANIGSAHVNISGGDIQAQFVMEAGASTSPDFTMTGGRIHNSHTTDNSEYANIMPYGGAVYIEDGTFTMSGGMIEKCSATKGGAVYIKKNGSSSPSFNMSGSATIKGCSSTSHGGGLYLEGGNVIINDGIIEKNRSSASGGGAYVSDGSFTMYDGDITGNYAATNGGGVAVMSSTSDVSVTISGGNIIDNWTDKSGGGISVIPSSGHSAFVTLGVDNQGYSSPDISRNGAAISGGGVYVKKDAGVPYARLTINSGKIKNNLVSTLVANPDVANDGGFVILKDGDVKHVIVTYHMNDGSIPETTSTQKIVTATRSTLNMPSWTISGYTLSWSDNPSGGGTSYTNGQEVNLTSGLHIYAHWTAQ